MEAKSIEQEITEKRSRELMELTDKIEAMVIDYDTTMQEWQGVSNMLNGRQDQMINAKLFKKYVAPTK